VPFHYTTLSLYPSSGSVSQTSYSHFRLSRETTGCKTLIHEVDSLKLLSFGPSFRLTKPASIMPPLVEAPTATFDVPGMLHPSSASRHPAALHSCRMHALRVQCLSRLKPQFSFGHVYSPLFSSGVSVSSVFSFAVSSPSSS